MPIRDQPEVGNTPPEAGGAPPRAGGGADEDARRMLYATYRSTFKAAKAATAALHAPAAPSSSLSSLSSSFLWWDHKYLPLLQDLDRAAPILDLGCGDGSLLAYLGRRGFSHAQGIDISAEQVAAAHARGTRAEQGDVFDFLPRHAEAFAAIIAADLFEHFSLAELVRLGPLVYAALRPGGRLLAQTANGAGLFPRQVIYGDLTHRTILTPESLQQWLRPCGFIGFRFYETGPIPVRLRGRLNLALWRLIKLGANAVRDIETGKRQAIWTENFLSLAYKPG
jgi:SAM-dependent methyltransferase